MLELCRLTCGLSVKLKLELNLPFKIELKYLVRTKSEALGSCLPPGLTTHDKLIGPSCVKMI